MNGKPSQLIVRRILVLAATAVVAVAATPVALTGLNLSGATVSVQSLGQTMVVEARPAPRPPAALYEESALPAVAEQAPEVVVDEAAVVPLPVRAPSPAAGPMPTPAPPTAQQTLESGVSLLPLAVIIIWVLFAGIAAVIFAASGRGQEAKLSEHRSSSAFVR